MRPIKDSVDSLNHKMNTFEQKIGNLEQKIENMDQRINNLDRRINNLNQRISISEVNVTNTVIRLRNGITKSIGGQLIPLHALGPQNEHYQVPELFRNQKVPDPAPLGSIPGDYDVVFPRYILNIEEMGHHEVNRLLAFYGIGNNQGMCYDPDDQLAEKRNALCIFLTGHPLE